MKPLKLLLIIAAMLNIQNMKNSLCAEIKLPTLLSNNMVLQRDIPINIWGWAKPGEKIAIEFNTQNLKTKVSANGDWKITLKSMSTGGPFEMLITGENTITLKNILIGDVWVCSGQSNMEWPLNQAKNGQEETANANNPKMRLFYVPKRISEKPLDNTLPAQWEECTPISAATFSAIGYFFGKQLQSKLDIPIGLINCNWGGTIAESWTDMQTMYGFSEYKQSLGELKTKNFAEQLKNMDQMQVEWQRRINTEDLGTNEAWYKSETNYSDWKKMKIPGYWENQGLKDVDGVVWFKTEFTLTADEAKNGITLNLGRIDDGDKTFVNGQLVGETPNQYNKVRNYPVQPAILIDGKNNLVVKVIDFGWGGGFYGDDADVYVLSGGNKKPLAGNWKYKIGISLPAPSSANNPNAYPSLLYNAMVNPMINFGIKGVIWYQGESNTKRPLQYREILKSMIVGWRKNWNQGDFPFLIVQLANFNSKGTSDDGDWALLRESQSVVANSLPNCGIVSTIDIGEPNDIHPKNKLDVGIRLALTALKVANGQSIIASGPVFKSVTFEGKKAIIKFDSTGSGLLCKNKYGYVNAFAVAGADKEFHWAKASIHDNRVIVEAHEVKQPVAVRYAWENNPEDVNLYNNENLPTMPFRTDNW